MACHGMVLMEVVESIGIEPIASIVRGLRSPK